MIYEVKLKETMGVVMQELIKAAAIENQLTGTVKLANEEKDPAYGVDDDVKLMSNPPATKGAPKPGTVSGAMPRGKTRAPPVGLSPEAVREFEKNQESTGRRARPRQATRDRAAALRLASN